MHSLLHLTKRQTFPVCVFLLANNKHPHHFCAVLVKNKSITIWKPEERNYFTFQLHRLTLNRLNIFKLFCMYVVACNCCVTGGYLMCISANQRHPLMVMSEGRGQCRGKVRHVCLLLLLCSVRSAPVPQMSLNCTYIRRLFVYIGCLHVRVFASSCFRVVVRTSDLFHTLAVWKNLML